MLLKAGVLSLVLLLVSRALGLARESAQAAAFGASGAGDVVVLMLSLPDWLTGLLASGSLAYVLLPQWARQAPAEQAAMQRHVARRLMLFGSVLTVALIVFAGSVVAWLAPGLTADLRPQAHASLLWSALALLPALLAALWVTRLQHERDFVGMYAANLMVNVVLIAAMALAAWQFVGWNVITVLGVGLFAAMGLRLVWLRGRLARHAPVQDTAVESVVLPPLPMWLWAALSAGLPLALPFAARSLASASGEGALATFNYAWKLVELPLVLAIQLAASLAFPVITRAFADEGDRAQAVRRAFAVTWVLAAAAVAGLLVAAPAAAQLLFGWGRMDAQGLQRIGEWGRIGAWGLLPQAVIVVALTVLATQQRMTAVVVAYAMAVAVLMAAGLVGGGEGGWLMAVLNAVLAGVALAVVAALGLEIWRWMPWRVMFVTLAVLLVLERVASNGWDFQSNVLLGIAGGAFFAILMVAISLLAMPELRHSLRQ